VRAAALVVAAVVGVVIYGQVGATGGRAVSTRTAVVRGGQQALANVFVSTSGNDSSCRRSNTPAAYAAATACQTLAAAYNVASAGDTIDVKAGQYPGGDLAARSLGSRVVTIAAAPGESVTLTGLLSIHASYVTVSGLALTQTYNIYQGASFVTMEDDTAPHAFIDGTNVTVTGGEIGPNDGCATGWEDGIQIWPHSRYTVIDGVTIHDQSDEGNQCANGPQQRGVHMDCIQLYAASDVTIENDTFYNCAEDSVEANPGPFDDVTIENTMNGPVVTPGAVFNIGDVTTVCNDFVVRYNTTVGTDPVFRCGGAGSSGNLVYGNIFHGLWTCGVNFSCSYNVTETTTPIGIGSRRCTPIFDPASTTVADYHLAAADKCARNAGDPRHHPALDIDGYPRPVGAAPDGGADELPWRGR